MAAPTANAEPTAAQPPPGLPDLTTVPEAERDAVWLEHYYQGDRVPQLTVRAVLMGGILGAFMAVSNLYATLKLGWAFGVAITACVLSYSIWNAFVAVGLAKTPMSILENNCMSSTASAAGYSTGGTLATAVGAMLLVTGDGGRLHWFPVAVWVALTAALGVFIAIPMKRQMINQEQLPFPSGIAAAETLRSLYADGRESLLKGRALIASMFFGGLVAVVRDVFGRIPSHVPFNFPVFTVRGRTVLGTQLPAFGFEPSALLIAAGMMVGIRVCTWMMVGSTVNYLVLAPYAAGLEDWQATGFVGHVEAAFAPDGALAMLKVTKWSLWLGTALLVSSGLTSFALSWRTIARAFQKFLASRSKSTAPREGGSIEERLEAIEVPTSWMIYGLVPITIGLVLLCWISLSIAPWLAVLSVVLAFVLSLVACRATGETDTTPIGAMGKITQFTYAILAPGNTTVNLMTAGVTSGAAGSAADLLTDLKSGYLLGANPRQQFIAQLAGVVFGVPAVMIAWHFLVPNASVLEESPATMMWFAVAQALAHGIEIIPLSARWAIAAGGVLGCVLSIAEARAPKAYRSYVPSSMGLGLSFVLPFQNSLSFFLGALIGLAWQRFGKASAERFLVPIASGVIAGESLAAAGIAMGTMGVANLSEGTRALLSGPIVELAVYGVFALLIGWPIVQSLRGENPAPPPAG